MRLPTYSVAVKGGRMPDHTAEPRELDGFRTRGEGTHACVHVCKQWRQTWVLAG